MLSSSKKKYICQSPVLFLVFNRPDVTAKVFDAIREARPQRLYVAADGPRVERAGETELCDEVRRVATDVDWDCDVKTLFRDENLGCKDAVSNGVSWFFEHEPEGIILEDDCLPVSSFFRYCDINLEQHREDLSIWSIGGTKFKCYPFSGKIMGYTSEVFYCWGWASWRSRWRKYSENLDRISLTNHNLSKDAVTYWKRVTAKLIEGSCSSWAYYFSISCIHEQCYNIVPPVSLVRNLGFQPSSTHTTKAPRIYSDKVCDFEFKNPIKSVRAQVYDRIYYNTFSKNKIRKYSAIVCTGIINMYEEIIKKIFYQK